MPAEQPVFGKDTSFLSFFFSPLLDSVLVLAQKACQHNLHRYLIFPHWLSSLCRSLQPFSLFLINILTPRKALTGLCVFLFSSHSFWARFWRSKSLCSCHLNVSRLIQLPCLLFLAQGNCKLPRSHETTWASCWNRTQPFLSARRGRKEVCKSSR